ncbi:MAG: hypothetical protein ACI9KE_004926 [Polyangiales bacterium]
MEVELEGEARRVLEQALSQVNALHLPGARALHRERLLRVIELTAEVLALESLKESTHAAARCTRALAQSARAQDARHGAGQLSRSAQRAPTSEDCELGWQNVETIVRGAELAAADAAQLAALTSERRVDKAAALASAAAEEARRIVERRNHAYTFHADPDFSFGEGWYVAAAGVLGNIEIQIESAQVQSAQVERFLRDAHLGSRLVPYRSRPRANKGLPALIAAAFAEDPVDAQRRLRVAFLGEERIPEAMIDWVDAALEVAPRDQRKVLVWVRKGVHDATRNSTELEVAELCRLAAQRGLAPVLFGDAVEGPRPPEVVDLSLCWKLPLFQGERMRRAQLQLFEHMVAAHGLVGQVGVTTAGMDGPALMGLPTMYITDKANPRLGRWVGVVPEYEEVVRADAYLEGIGATFSRWASNAF